MAEPSAGGLRVPLFVIAVVAAALVVATELALSFAVGGAPVSTFGGSAAGDALGVPPDLGANLAEAQSPPGAGIRYLALVDGLLLFTVLLLGSSMLLSQRVYARYQGAVTFVVSLLWVVLSLVLALVALAKLLLMVGLLLAVPFGTIAYLVVWGWFPVGTSAVLLGLMLFLKVVVVVCLVLAQPRFLAVKGLMALIAASVVLQLVLGLIQGFLPRVLVSIGDDLWALVTAVVALVWAVVMLVTSVPAIVNAIRVSRSVTQRPAT